MRFWKRVDKNGETTTVESYSHNLKVKGAVEITKQEYDDFLASLPIIEPEPPRDLFTEIDEIKAKIADYDELKAKVEELERK